MKKCCDNCAASYFADPGYCEKYDCRQDEVVKEKDNPSCWEEIPPDFYDMHACDYENGCCRICGAVQYKSMLYCDLHGCDL